jgi:hypothetical protein
MEKMSYEQNIVSLETDLNGLTSNPTILESSVASSL